MTILLGPRLSDIKDMALFNAKIASHTAHKDEITKMHSMGQLPKQIVNALFLTLALHTFPAMASELKPFTSDGCSSFPDGTLEHRERWLTCCQAHDFAYWKGGTYQDRLQADKELKLCVAETGNPKIAELMLAGVRVGGTPYLPTKFRWGYGWPYFRGYKEPTQEEIVSINKLSE